MNKFIMVLIIVLSISKSGAQNLVSIERTVVDPSRRAAIVVEFDSDLRRVLNPSGNPSLREKYALVNGADEWESIPSGKVYCSEIQTKIGIRFISFIFDINSANIQIFEKLPSDSTAYYLQNEEPIELANATIERGQLAAMTLGRIRTILEEDWNRYILNEYSSHFLFPHSFKVGTRLGIEDTTKTVYFLEVVQAGSWGSLTAVSTFWGLKGRWSTDRNDKFNYVQFYPLTLLYNQTSWRISLSTGVETGDQGFGKQGRGTLKGETQFRVPFNPVDFTLGNPRWRINPVMNFSVQRNLGWADVSLPDSLKRSLDVTGKIRYDVPVGKNYYLQTNARGNYSTITKEIQYQYDISLGYIADGTIRIMAQFKQGYQEVTYQFDRQLLLGFVIDVLNESVAK